MDESNFIDIDGIKIWFIGAKNNKTNIDNLDLSIYSTDEFREYYSIVKSKSKFTINIDKNSLYYIGIMR